MEGGLGGVGGVAGSEPVSDFCLILCMNLSKIVVDSES